MEKVKECEMCGHYFAEKSDENKKMYEELDEIMEGQNG